MTRTGLVASVFALALVAPLSAHDFWLRPMQVHTAPGSTVTLSVNVGEQFPAPDAYVAPDRVDMLHLIGPGKKVVDVSPKYSREGEALLTPVTLPATPGTYIAEVRLKPRFIELAPTEFTAYLKEEGLERVVTEREKLGETAKPGRERYSRWPKALIHTGDADATHVTTPLGVTSELVPSVDPTRAKVGQPVAFQLRFEGKPIAGARVTRIVSGTAPFASRLTHVTTDADGWARFTITEAVPTFIGTVHMVRRGGESGLEAADWESYWTSITFEPAK